MRSVIVAVAMLAASASAGHACTCVVLSPEIVLANVPLIVEGEVAAIDGGSNGLSGVATITVTKVIKGESGDAAVAVTARGPCGLWFRQGQRLMLALEAAAGAYTTNLCLMQALRQRLSAPDIAE